jgi:2-oxoglutarate dehydrogenase complex dehydrogenase (E1) component-like enzyme
MHVVVNNQIGFTTECHKGRSSWYCTDVLRSVHAPAIHVNADDPEAVVIATRLAMDYLTTFRKDIIVDLHGYRRHGHNELDEPSFTQPLMYDSIRVRPTIAKLYGEKLIVRFSHTHHTPHTTHTHTHTQALGDSGLTGRGVCVRLTERAGGHRGGGQGDQGPGAPGPRQGVR